MFLRLHTYPKSGCLRLIDVQMDSVRYTYVFGHPIYELTLLLLLLLQGSSFLYLFLCFRVGVGKKISLWQEIWPIFLPFEKVLYETGIIHKKKFLVIKYESNFFFAQTIFLPLQRNIHRSLLAWLQVISENCFMLFLMIHYIIISLYHKHVRKSLFVKCRQQKRYYLISSKQFR